MGKKHRSKRQVDKARLQAVKVLFGVLEENAFSNESAAFHLADPELDARDRAFASAIIFGTLSNLPRIDYDLSRVSSRPIDKLDPWIRTILRAGIWQLFYSYQATKAAACDESVRLARHLTGEKMTGFVNGICRRLARSRPTLEGPNRAALKVGLPVFLFDQLSAWYGADEAEAIGQWSLESPEAITIRANLCQMDAFLNWSGGEEAIGMGLVPRTWPPHAYALTPKGRSVSETTGYKQGLYTLQSRAAMMVGALSGVVKNERVLDLCASPGGKTGHVAELADCKLDMLASDITPERVSLLEKTLERLGHDFVKTAVHDATVVNPAWRESFDLVLCDVPCSGLGLIQKRPEIRLRVNAESIERLIGIQRDILEHAASAVAPGGRLLYSTCTLNPHENELQIERFLASEAGQTFELEDLKAELVEILPGEIKLPMSERLPGSVFFWPPRDQTDGFFIARLRRRPDRA